MNATSSPLGTRWPDGGWRHRILTSALLLGLGVLLGAAWAGAKAAPAPAYDVGNSVKAFARGATETTPVGYQFWFFDKDFAQGRSIKLSVVRPHLATHAPPPRRPRVLLRAARQGGIFSGRRDAGGWASNRALLSASHAAWHFQCWR